MLHDSDILLSGPFIVFINADCIDEIIGMRVQLSNRHASDGPRSKCALTRRYSTLTLSKRSPDILSHLW